MTGSNKQAGAETTVVHSGLSFSFRHHNAADHVFASMAQSGAFYEIDLLVAVAPFLRRGDLVFDVGANVGTHSVFFAGVCGCEVTAFEPNSAASAILVTNIAANSLQDRVAVEEVALGAKPGRARIIPGAENNLGTVRVEMDENGDVAVVALDDYIGIRRVKLIKIDVEGSELSVLNGARKILERDHPVVTVEARTRAGYNEIRALLSEFGYVSAGTYGFTPTHVFVDAARHSIAEILATFGGRIALDRIGDLERNEQINHLKKWVGNVQQSLRTSQGTIGAIEATLAEQGRDAVELKGTASKLASALDGVTRHANVRDEQTTYRLDAIGQTLEFIVTAIQRLEARDEAMHALLTETLGCFTTKVDARLAAIRESLAATDLRFGSVNAALADAATRDNAAMELQLLVSSALEASLASAVGRLKREQARSIETVVAPIACAHLDAMGRSLADAVGRQLAQVEIDLRNVLRVDPVAAGRSTAHPASSAEDITAIESALARIAENLPGAAAETQPTNETAAAKSNPWNVRKVLRAAIDDGAVSDKTARRWSVNGNGAAVFRRSDGAADGVGARRKMPLRFSAPNAVVCSSEHFVDDWSGRAWAQPTIDLQPGGQVICREAKANSGIVGRTYRFEGGGLLEVEVVSTTLGPAGALRFLRLVGDDGEGIGHDAPLRDGPTVVRVYAPARLKAVKVYILALDPKPGPLFTLTSLELRKVDPTAHQRAVSLCIGEPVYASLASIPSRQDMLGETVGSLLAQCDKVRVFLNNYTDVPACLDHPRVEVCRSQDWDDRGDAGKMFWLERDRHEGGYRLIVDDDLIFPPDFAAVMTEKVAAHGNRAIYATHGVLLRQPVVNYYSKGSRAATFHFGHELQHDRGVHIGATNALCLHSTAVDMRWQDFKYCNSADIWLSLYAQKQRLPILTPARPRNWIRENRHAKPEDTIYQHSLARTRTRFDSSFVQDSALRHAGTVTLQTAGRRKLGVAFLLDDLEKSEAVVKSFLARRSVEVEWVVMFVFDGSDPKKKTIVDALSIGQETHLVDSSGDLRAAMQNVARLHRSLDLEATLIASPETRFVSEGARCLVSGNPVSHQGVAVTPLYAGGGTQAVAAVFSAAASDPVGVFAGTFLSDANTASGLQLAFGANAAGDDIAQAIVSLAAPTAPAEPSKCRGDSINTFFDRILVLNLDRRPDRWEGMSKQLDAAGISAQRFSAVDGSNAEVRAEYHAYAEKPIHTVSQAVAPVVHSSDLYLAYESQMARIAHLEGRTGKKAIESAGAWGYLRSYEAILEQALIDQVDSLLVLDDDVIFHKNSRALFAAASAELPDDWMILQLGTLQYNWTGEWIKMRSLHLYSTNGSAVGSHAVGLRFDALPYVLDHVKRMDMPFDIGALSATTRAFKDRCFVVTPNIAIQRLGDSDINTSEYQKSRSRVDVAQTYRWNLEHYHP